MAIEIDEDQQAINVGKRLAIELGTSLTFEIKGVPTRIRTQLFGMDTNKYLILKAPQPKLIRGLESFLMADKPVKVRYAFDGSVFSFDSTIMGSVTKPVSLLFITCPEKVVEHQIRDSQRVDCFLPSKIEVNDLVLQGTIIDISRSGCQCTAIGRQLGEWEALLDANELPVVLRFELPGIEGEQHLAGYIRNFKRDSYSLQFGVKFDELVPKVYNRLLEYLLTSDE